MIFVNYMQIGTFSGGLYSLRGVHDLMNVSIIEWLVKPYWSFFSLLPCSCSCSCSCFAHRTKKSGISLIRIHVMEAECILKHVEFYYDLIYTVLICTFAFVFYLL